eukprot:CAMPEP_0171854188 /NCGR_PEP_ID=MMETSP0992-20121227/22725_1 /TAXON_ID=483369 /ORGANISM="non described non described, Strain CCMP2098" /LENGTH=87 /DNA_ID=CAMNT_0012474745 /DNA_START=110 /DNA_END=370 /DNA_ORIENTATION=+
MELQLSGFRITVPWVGGGCVIVPVAAAAASPAAYRPLRPLLACKGWGLHPPGRGCCCCCWCLSVPRGGIYVPRATLAPVVPTVAGSR